MSNLINLNNIISSQTFVDNKQFLQLSEISTELLQAIKIHKTGMLEVLANSDGFDFILQMGDNSFPINLKNNIQLQIHVGEKLVFPVKVNSSGNITVISQDNPNNLSKDNAVIIKTSDIDSTKITLTPIKLQKFIEQNIKDKTVDTNIKKQILQIAKDIDISLKSVGNISQNEVDVQKIQNIIKELIDYPQKSSNLLPKLEEAFSNLVGKQLSGEIVNKINQLYVIKTALGETYFSSDMKIPVSEKVMVEINSQISVNEQNVKIIDNILKNIIPADKTKPSIETFLKDSVFKQVIETIQNIDTNLLNLISSKLPFQNENLFENIYNFYKGIIRQDITQWLGGENIAELLSDSINGQKNIAELNNMLQGLLKETPTWKIVEMPFFDSNQVSSIKIAIKKDKQKKEKTKSEKTTRFIVETEFSKLGKFQFDGLSKVQSRHLDLIIRTTSKISKDFYENIINLFKKSLYNLNYSGTIKINMAENFINFNEENTITKGVYV